MNYKHFNRLIAANAHVNRRTLRNPLRATATSLSIDTQIPLPRTSVK